MLNEYTIKLEPLTPIHVWGGKDAIVGVDAFIKNNRLYVLDEEVLRTLTWASLERILNLEPSNMFTKLFEEISNRYDLKPLAEVKTQLYPRSRIKILHKNVVPGSTLKGYIRSSVIRALLETLPKEQIMKVINNGIDLQRKPTNVGIGLEAELLRRSRLKMQGGFIDIMDSLSISDPISDNVRAMVMEFHVVNKEDLRAIAKTYAVALVQGILKFKVTSINYLTRPELVVGDSSIKDILKHREFCRNTLANPKWVLDAIRKHGCRIIDAEISKVSNKAGLSEYLSLLKEWRSELCKEGVNCVPARIGFMTGHESKTLLDVVRNVNHGLYIDVVKKMSSYVKKVWDERTLKLVKFDGKFLGIGWCKLCIE